MKKMIGKGLDIMLTLLSMIAFCVVMFVWVFFPEKFVELPTNDLIIFVLMIIIGLMPEKKIFT